MLCVRCVCLSVCVSMCDEWWVCVIILVHIAIFPCHSLVLKRNTSDVYIYNASISKKIHLNNICTCCIISAGKCYSVPFDFPTEKSYAWA